MVKKDATGGISASFAAWLAHAGVCRVLVVALIAATAARFALVPVFGNRFVFLTYFPVVMLAAMLGGWRWGALATVVSALLAYALFFGSWNIPPDELSALCVFLVCNLAIIFLADRVQVVRRSAERDAAEARGRELAAQRELAELREARSALRESEDRLRFAMRAAGAGIWDWDAVSGHVAWDQGNRDLHGLDQGRPPSYENWQACIHPDDREPMQRVIADTIAQRGLECRFEYRVLRPEKGERWLEGLGSATYSPDGVLLRMTGVNVDITSRKHAEASLRDNEERLRFALLGAGAGMWDWDIQTGRIVWDKPYYQLWGLDPAITPSYENWIRFIVPEDREPAARDVQNVLDTKRTGFRTEFRIQHPARGVRWIRSMGYTTYAPDGTPLRMTGISVDITEQRTVELELKSSRDELERRVEERTAELRDAGRAIAESEERFRQVTAAIDQVFWLSDSDKNQVLYVSPAYERIWGRTCDSLRASPRNWMEAIHPDDRARVMTAAIDRQALGTYDEEYRILRPDGSERWIRDRAFPIPDSTGKVTRIAGVADDITERKKLQRDLISAIEREQERIGRDLHDGLCQILTGAKFKTALLGQKISSGSPAAASGEAGSIELLLDEAIAQARGMAQGLNPVQARPGGLAESLTQLAALMNFSGGPRCTCDISESVEINDPVTAVQLYRIAQEAIQNAIKHSRATTIQITLERRDSSAILIITDDGCGLPAPETPTTGRGLFNMKSRASAIGGHLEIKSQPGRGTTVTCQFNLPRTTEGETA